MTEQALTIWTVYEHPSDFPDHFVARPFYVGPGLDRGNQVLLAETLDELRALLPAGLICMARSENDDPVIVEVWF
jgi:hypothetical protein